MNGDVLVFKNLIFLTFKVPESIVCCFKLRLGVQEAAY